MQNDLYTILIADDEESNLRLYTESLRMEGYNIITARDGDEALNLAVSRQPDIIVSDVMMPNLSGIELTKLLKTNPVTAFIPIILVTGLTDFEDVLKGLEAGADDYLSKPVNILELKTRIRGALRAHNLQRSLNSANRTISILTKYSSHLITQFNPASFNYDAYVQNIIDILLKNTDESIRNTPWGIVVGRFNLERITGELFFRDENDIIQSTEISIHLNHIDHFPITSSPIYHCNNCNGRFPTIQTKTGEIDIKNFASIIVENDIIIFINFTHSINHFDLEILNYLFLLCESFKKLSFQIQNTENAFRYAVEALSRAAEANDEDTGNHIVRVNAYSRAIARELRLPERFIEDIGFFAQMHDVGKIHIHPDILRKKGALNEMEFAEIKKHPVYGAKILGDEARLSMAKNIALTHHERFDGSGYPSGLKQKEIPLEGRIVSLADIYDALRNPRSYKPAYDHDTTVRIISQGDGRTLPSHFDPEVLKAFIRIQSEFDEIYKKLK